MLKVKRVYWGANFAARVIQALEEGPCTAGGVCCRMENFRTDMAAILNALARRRDIMKLGDYMDLEGIGVDVFAGTRQKFFRRDCPVYCTRRFFSDFNRAELVAERRQRLAQRNGSGQVAGPCFATGYANWPRTRRQAA